VHSIQKEYTSVRWLAFIDQVTWYELTNGRLPYWHNLLHPPHKEVDILASESGTRWCYCIVDWHLVPTIRWL